MRRDLTGLITGGVRLSKIDKYTRFKVHYLCLNRVDYLPSQLILLHTSKPEVGS